MWTRFYDLHTDGVRKTKWKAIFIEAEKDRAIEIFKKAIDRNPLKITCECCGEDYDIEEGESLEKLTEDDRSYSGISLSDWLKKEFVIKKYLFITKMEF